jgi:FkbM family methyltransferase
MPERISLIENLLARQFHGVGRLRSFFRAGHPISLVRGKTVDGLVLALDPASFLDRIIISTGYYERDVLDAILSHLPPNGVFWDVGSNVGLHSITTKHLRPDVTVVAFEPVPFMAGRVMRNAELNNVEVRLLAVALGPSSGYAPLSVKVRGNSGLSSLVPWAGTKYEAVLTCRIETGAGLIDAGIVPAPAVIKIDVEGYEAEVLKGINLADPNLQAIIFESNGQLLNEICELLGASGFETQRLLPANTSDGTASNYIATKRLR